MEVRLVVLEGNSKGRTIPLPSTQFIIGRALDCHLRPHSSRVSKHHCAIGRSARNIVVRDLKSRNGTFINEERISSSARVNDGDVLTIGPLSFEFSINLESGDEDVQSIRQDHVRWLMQSENPFDKNQQYDTQTVHLANDLMDMNEDSDSSISESDSDPYSDDQGMSAGRFLHDYFRNK